MGYEEERSRTRSKSITPKKDRWEDMVGDSAVATILPVSPRIDDNDNDNDNDVNNNDINNDSFVEQPSYGDDGGTAGGGCLDNMDNNYHRQNLQQFYQHTVNNTTVPVAPSLLNNNDTITPTAAAAAAADPSVDAEGVKVATSANTNCEQSSLRLPQPPPPPQQTQTQTQTQTQLPQRQDTTSTSTAT
eukprot:CAMPEP_0170777584 /NCGR_PEP_ID=MMETSP0733-20121128/11869_1 /TAXON_ID=186038 /ORGANISM="Fragilariopsis kerguelensis, Strain L26-C5" /LENGTH=187 /DNA_ID=CAMNT_0011120817 /DNA_START=583 /DNA_END=1144 /DNA_ORIENTATION=-